MLKFIHVEICGSILSFRYRNQNGQQSCAHIPSTLVLKASVVIYISTAGTLTRLSFAWRDGLRDYGGIEDI